MSLTLDLIDQLLARGRRYLRAGQYARAVALYTKLASFPALEPDKAGEVQARLGEAWLRRRRFRLARRHLRRALKHRPRDPRCHFLLGLARAGDPAENPRRALVCYRRSLALAPDQPRCLGEAGLLLVRLGRTAEGLALLRQAIEKFPDDVLAVGRLVKGLCQSGRPDDALAAVRAALFRAPRCRRLRKMQADLQLAELCRRQELATASQSGEGPVLLPFLRPVAEVGAGVREDRAAGLSGPHLVRLPGRVCRRRAP